MTELRNNIHLASTYDVIFNQIEEFLNFNNRQIRFIISFFYIFFPMPGQPVNAA